MKLQNINSTFYIEQKPAFKAKQFTTTTTKPAVTPVKKSGKTLGGIILSGLAALGIVSKEKQTENNEEKKELTYEEFCKIREKMRKKVSDSDLIYLINNRLTKENIDLFNWILNNWKNGGNKLTKKLYRDSNETEKANTLFNIADIPHENIAGILEKYHWSTNDIELATELYRLNREKSEEFKPYINKYEPKNGKEAFNKELVIKYLNEPNYRQYLDYMTQEKLEKFLQENPFSNGVGAGDDVLHSVDEETFDLRLDFAKFLADLPKSIKWKTLYEPKGENELYHLNQRIFSCVDKNNIDFAKELISSNRYDIDQVMSILGKTNSDNIDTIRTIVNDRRTLNEANSLTMWNKISDGLWNIDKENAKRVLELFYLNKKIQGSVANNLVDFTKTPQLTMDLCKEYKINPLFVAGRNYITPETAPLIKKINDSPLYNDYYYAKRDLVKMLSTCDEAKKLLEVLVDNKYKMQEIEDIFDSVFDNYKEGIQVNKIPKEEQLDAILKIAGCKDITHEQAKELLNNCLNRPIKFLAKHLVDNKTIDPMYISSYWQDIDNTNIGLVSKLLWNKDFSQKYLHDILIRFYESDSEQDVLDIINSGRFNGNEGLVKSPTDAWKYILDNNLKFEEIDEDTISAYAKSGNSKILELHKQLKQDVYANKNLLKPGLDDLTDEDLNEFLEDKDTIITLGRVGKGVLESTFPETIYGVQDFCEDIAEMKLPEDLYDKLMLKIYPENSNKYKDVEREVKELKAKIKELLGEENLNRQRELGVKIVELENYITPHLNPPHKGRRLPAPNGEWLGNGGQQTKKDLQSQIKALKSERNAILYNSENVEEIKEIIKEITQKRSLMKQIVAQKVDLSPQQIAEKVRVIAQIANANLLTEDAKKSQPNTLNDLIDLIQSDTKENEDKWNNYLNKEIFHYIYTEYNEGLSKKLDLIHSKYLSKLFVSSEEFFKNLDNLVKIIKQDINSPIEKIIDNLPQNIETKQQFEELRIDYEKWTKVDKNSYVKVKVKLDASEAKRAVIENLEEDLNDEMLGKIPIVIESGLHGAIKEAGFKLVKDKKVIHDENGFNIGQKDFYRIYKDNKPIEFEDLGKVINAIKEQINSDEFWFKENEIEDVEKAREHLYYHLMKMRVPEFENAKNMKDGEDVDIEVRKTNMYDIKKALGLGNDAACCTALGANSNEWTAPNYIMDKCIGAIELTDRGNFAGNTMIYLAQVDGELSLILDNIEMKSKYQFNNAIRDAFFEYTRKLCTEIGKPCMPIYAGPNRHKVDMTGFEIKERKMKIAGHTGEYPIYLDFDADSHGIDGNGTFSVDLYRIS